MFRIFFFITFGMTSCSMVLPNVVVQQLYKTSSFDNKLVPQAKIMFSGKVAHFSISFVELN